MKLMTEIKDAFKGNNSNDAASSTTTAGTGVPPPPYPQSNQLPPDIKVKNHADFGYKPAYIPNQGNVQNPLALMPPPPPMNWPMPKLRVQVAELDHPGVIEFFKVLHPTELMKEAVIAVFTHLYKTPERCPKQYARNPTIVCSEILTGNVGYHIYIV